MSPELSVELTTWIENAQGKRVLVIGDLILDRYVYGDAERISPEAPVPVIRVVERSQAVGGSANVAACLRALGCRVTVCGIVGDDRHGQSLRDLMAQDGVDIDPILVCNDRPTTAKTRMVGLAQHRHRQQLLRVDEEDTRPIAEATASELVQRAKQAMQDADIVCIEDYDKGVITAELVRAVQREARQRDIRILVDPARLDRFDRYAGVDILTPNREELATAMGVRIVSVDDVIAAGTDLLAKLGAGALVATLDREGAVIIESGGKARQIPTIPRSVYDNTGAGDAVLSMLATALAGGAELDDAVRLANIAGGLEVEKFGCVPIAAEEVLAELRLEQRRQGHKLRSEDELLAELNLRRDRGETVVFTNGCFDILHVGHIEYLKRCRQLGSCLVVGLNSDDSVRSLNKGPNRPINRFQDRATVLSALECVDYVVGFDAPDPETLIRQVRPNVLAKGEDWADKGVVGADFVEANGGKVILIPLVEGMSTTHLVEQIQQT